MAFLVHNLPPIEVYVKKEYLYDLQKGHGELTPGVWISIRSIMGKALYIETLLTEYGALYDKLPLSAFVWKEDYDKDGSVNKLRLDATKFFKETMNKPLTQYDLEAPLPDYTDTNNKEFAKFFQGAKQKL